MVYSRPSSPTNSRLALRATMTTVGIIANPAASKDIRRLVAQGRVVPDWGKGQHRPAGSHRAAVHPMCNA